MYNLSPLCYNPLMTYTIPIDGQQYVPVMDVSGWQFKYDESGKLKPGALPPNYSKARTMGIEGIFARIGNGTSLDESFALSYQPAVDAGLRVGAYYYAQPNGSTATVAAARVAAWLNPNAKPYKLTLPVMLDWESYYGAVLSRSGASSWISTFMSEILKLTKMPCILYAGNVYVNATTSDPITIAPAPDTIQPRYPRQGIHPPASASAWPSWIPWTKQPQQNAIIGVWDGWQFSADGVASAYGLPPDGANPNVDLNIVRLAEYTKWCKWADDANAPPIPPEPTPPDETVEINRLRVFTKTKRIYDSRLVSAPVPVNVHSAVLPVTILDPPPSPGMIPRFAQVTVTAVPVANPATPGFVYATNSPGTSLLNYANVPVANTTILPIIGGRITVTASTPVHVIFDLIGILYSDGATPS